MTRQSKIPYPVANSKTYGHDESNRSFSMTSTDIFFLLLFAIEAMHKCRVTNAESINYTLITIQSQVARSDYKSFASTRSFFALFRKKEGKKILSIYVCNCKFRQREKMNSINSQEAVIAIWSSTSLSATILPFDANM